jgi:hypothetical protein
VFNCSLVAPFIWILSPNFGLEFTCLGLSAEARRVTVRKHGKLITLSSFVKAPWNR